MKEDVAEAATNALLEAGHEWRTYALNGPRALTGEACAEVYADVLGREVRCAGDDLAAFHASVSSMIPGWLAWDAVLMYELFQERGMAATERELDETCAISDVIRDRSRSSPGKSPERRSWSGGEPRPEHGARPAAPRAVPVIDPPIIGPSCLPAGRWWSRAAPNRSRSPRSAIPHPSV